RSGLAESKRGTYAGLVEKIPYVRDLGITAVELLPVFQFDPQVAPPGRTNYWGYAPVSFFAPTRDTVGGGTRKPGTMDRRSASAAWIIRLTTSWVKIAPVTQTSPARATR